MAQFTLTGTAASNERAVIRDGSTRIGTLRKVFNGMFKGRKVYGWQPFDATGRLLMSQNYEVRDDWSGNVIGNRAAGVSEKIAIEAVISAAELVSAT